MRVFVTGASGFIGSAVAGAFARGGHDVLGLVRSPGKASALHAAAVATVTGNLEAPEGWIGRASECEVLVHAAAEYSKRMFDLDLDVVSALLEVARETKRPRAMIYTSGTWVYGDTKGSRVDEDTPPTPHPYVARRVVNERAVLEGGGGPLRTIVIRPGCVYGGAGSLTATWFETASKEGAARIVGDGSCRWNMVHRDDLARLYVLAAGSASSGEIFNAGEPSRSTVRECAQAASRAAGADGKVVSIPVEEAVKKLGAFAECLALDQDVDSGKAERILGWRPRHRGFVDEAERCFLSWKAFGS